MRRIKVLLALSATMVLLLTMMAAPVAANDWDDWHDDCIGVHSGGECIGVGDDHHRWHGWNHWGGWNFWNDWDLDDCFWWDGDLFCEVDW